MHRHGYSGRKLSLDRGPRRAVIRGQMTALVLHEQITTTEAHAKETLRAFEQLVTRAKQGGLSNLRHVRSVLLTENATKKLVEDLVPALQSRNSGHVRLIKIGLRRGDNAPMAVLSVIRDAVSSDKLQAASSQTEESKLETGNQKPDASSSKIGAKKAKPAAKKEAVK